MQNELTFGSLFAGIGGIDLGFEQAGWETAWQVELNPINRATLADRFPHARRFEDVRKVGAHNLQRVACITAGFPCQDISNSGSCAGKRPGLERGTRSGLFFEVLRIIDEIQPPWVVLENVPALLHSNDCKDIETVVASLAERSYLGFARVLDAQYFGVPQKRRRIFLVSGLGRYPSPEFLADAGFVDSLPCTLGPFAKPRPAHAWAGNTLQAENAPGRLSLGSAVLVAETDRWGACVERARTIRNDGLCKGLDDPNFATAFAAGNSVSPPVAKWIAEILKRSG